MSDLIPGRSWPSWRAVIGGWPSCEGAVNLAEVWCWVILPANPAGTGLKAGSGK